MNSKLSEPRILVIPSWYPTTANPVTGSFFQEQAALLQQRFDMRVLHGIGRPTYYRAGWKAYRWIARPGLARVLPPADGFIPGPPPAFGFEYAHRSKSEEDRLKATVHAYQQKLEEVIAAGWKPDLLHAQCAETGGIIAAALARKFGIPFVLTEHHIFILANYGEYRRRLMIDALNEATRLVAVSHHQMRCIIMHGVDRPMAVIGNLIDETLFPPAEPVSGRSEFHILTVTWPGPIKDSETFFRAIGVLAERGHRDIRVTVIGNNAWLNLADANTGEFESLAAKYGVTDYCRFVAHVPRAEMPGYYAGCDVFVSTSIAETFGVAVREAMVTGRPAVCTASGGVEDDLSPVNGIKVNIRDHGALAEALISVKSGATKFDPRQVRDSIVAGHGRQAFLDKMTALYDDALGASGR